MEPKTLYELLGKPKPEDLEAKVREYNTLYLAASNEEEKGVLLDTCKTLLDVQVFQAEQAEVNAAKTSISRAAKELAELKTALREGEYITCEMRNSRSTVSWEIVTPAGERHPWDSPSVLGHSLSQEDMQKLASGDKAVMREIRSRAKAITQQGERLKKLRELCDTVARMVAEGAELVITKGSAIVSAEVRMLRAQTRNRFRLIQAGHNTAEMADHVLVDGKKYAMFSEVEG